MPRDVVVDAFQYLEIDLFSPGQHTALINEVLFESCRSRERHGVSFGIHANFNQQVRRRYAL